MSPTLTLNLPNFLNGKIHKALYCWLTSSIEPGQTIRMCRLAWLYTGGKGDYRPLDYK